MKGAYKDSGSGVTGAGADSPGDPVEYTIGKLNELYRESEKCDADVFAEMKTNILLVSGQHFKQVQKGLMRNMSVINGNDNQNSKRLRLVKNHTAKAVSDIKDIMASMTPGVLPYPKLEHERDCQKAAELSKAVWEDGKQKNDFSDQVDNYRNCFVTTGEVCSKIFYNPIAGGLKGYKQKTHELTGQPMFKDHMGQETEMSHNPMTGMAHDMVRDETLPVFNGQVVIEKFEPYNLLRHKNAKSMRTAKFLIYRKMSAHEEVKSLIESSNFTDEEKKERIAWLTTSSETTYKIFNGTTGSFQDSKGELLLREFYFRQSTEFPKGHFFICCDDGILFEGDLPFGEHGEIAFPIKWGQYELYEGSARGFSVIKRLKASQLECNRCASSVAEVQTVMGWDKILLSKNAKFSRGVDQPGMRVFHTTDGQPVVIPGRGGEQFMSWLEHNIAEIYQLAKLPENNNPAAASTDPKIELFKRQSQRSRFSEPAGRIARFFTEICETHLFLSSHYLSDDQMIQAIGKTKHVDIKEFKGINRLDYKVKMMEVSDDLDSMLGKSIELETIAQYMGKNMDPETSKVLLTQFPILNKARAFKHVTIDLENIESDLLAMDRGEWRPADRDDKHEMYVQHLTYRIKQRDFDLLAPEIQQMFRKKREDHQHFIAQLIKEQQEMEAGFIPSGGALAKADLYVNPDPSQPTKTQRAVFPTEALQWLKDKLDKQGSTQNLLSTIESQSAVADISKMAPAQVIQNQDPSMIPMNNAQNGTPQ